MKKVLIAEDNPINRELLREILEAHHYEVAEASDGREALAKIVDIGPDVVLLDINMPIMDGFATLKRLKEDPRFSRLPVLAVTAYAMKDDQERILAAGFSSYLSKPINSAALLREVQRFIR